MQTRVSQQVAVKRSAGCRWALLGCVLSLFICGSAEAKKTETAKVAKLKIYEDPKKLNKSLFSSISKSQFKKYNATSTVSYLFFESSENYLISLELLYRAYDLNTEAEKIRSHISYMKESKSSEKQRLQSTQQIVQSQSSTIKSNIKNK